jgi:queuosine precursor transporter
MKIQKIDLLVAIYTGCIAISELMGAKTVPLFTLGNIHLTASVALLVVPLLFASNDIVVEVHGKERARSIVFSGLIVIALLLGMSLLATNLPASPHFAHDEPAYDTVFGKSARIAGASLAAFALAELLDVWVFSKLRQKLGKRALWLRTNVSNICAQSIDTAVFIVLAFYAFGTSFTSNVGFLVGLILPYWLLKCCVSALETPLVYLGVTWLRGSTQQKTEG